MRTAHQVASMAAHSSSLTTRSAHYPSHLTPACNHVKSTVPYQAAHPQHPFPACMQVASPAAVSITSKRAASVTSSSYARATSYPSVSSRRVPAAGLFLESSAVPTCPGHVHSIPPHLQGDQSSSPRLLRTYLPLGFHCHKHQHWSLQQPNGFLYQPALRETSPKICF